MNPTILNLYLVPGNFWEERSDAAAAIAEFVDDALAIERRIQKGIDLENERMRYQLCCRRIQEFVKHMGSEWDSEILGQGYFDFMQYLYAKFPAEMTRNRLAACFFPPTKISAQIVDFKRLIQKAGLENNDEIKKRVAFFEKVCKENAGAVEIADFLVPGETESTKDEVAITLPLLPEIRSTGYEWGDELSKEEVASLLNILKSRIQKALESGGEINFSNQPHMVVADALNEFVYKEKPDEPEKLIRVVYMDGSESEPFFLRCLTKPNDLNTGQDLPIVKAALISMRHLEMDEKIDFAWFRNRKVSVARPFAETDSYCTARTMELLKKIENKALHLHLYQTGLETAVVGFYRGLVRVLKERRKRSETPPLRVVPYYYSSGDGQYKPGRTWI